MASLIAQAAVDLSSPRATFKTFLKAMVSVKNKQNVGEAYSQAMATLDLSEVDPAAKKEAAIKISESLIYIFDRMERIDYDKIPLNPKADTWVYNKKQLDEKSIEISLNKIDSKWLFSKETIQSIPAYKELLKETSIVEGVVKLSTWREKLRNTLPVWSQKEILFIEIWQWMGLLFLVIVAYLVEKIISYIGRLIINKNVHFFQKCPKMLEKADFAQKSSKITLKIHTKSLKKIAKKCKHTVKNSILKVKNSIMEPPYIKKML